MDFLESSQTRKIDKFESENGVLMRLRGELQDLINARQERDSLLDKRAEEKRKTWHDKNALFVSKAREGEDNKARPEIAQTK